jgi:hypothetical protein
MLIHRNQYDLLVSRTQRLQGLLVYRDSGIRGDRVINAGCAGDLQLARKRGHRRDEYGIPGRPCKLKVKPRVELRYARPVVDRPPLKLNDPIHLGEVGLIAVPRGEHRNRRLQDSTRLKHQGNSGEPRLHSLHEQRGNRFRNDKRPTARSRPNLNHPRLGENAKGFTECRPTHLHLFGKQPLRWQSITPMEMPGPNRLRNLSDHRFKGSPRTNRLEDRRVHRPNASATTAARRPADDDQPHRVLAASSATRVRRKS